MLIDGVNFYELECQKYWSFPKSYKKDSKTETKNMIFSGDYIGARKMDGAFYKFIKDEEGNMGLFGRSKSVTGVYLDKINWVPHLKPFFDTLPNGTCLLGEIYFPDKEGSSNVTTIMGCLEEKARDRQHKNGYLYYYIFDVLAYDGVSLYKKNIEDRLNIIKKIEEETKLLRHWRLYLDMVGKNGVSKMVLRKTLPIINAQITNLLCDVCDFNVEISITDKNDIMFYLIKDGIKSDLTSGSGFERTAAALALRTVLGNISSLPRVNFLICDEILGRVAKENFDNMKTLYEKMLANYDFIIQISHLDEIKDWHNHIVTVTKTNNVSKINIIR